MKKNLLLFFTLVMGMISLAQTTINSTPVTTATVGTVYTSPITAVTTTNNPITFSTVGTLPAFLSLSTGGSSQGVQIGNTTIADASAVASDTNGNYYVVQFGQNSIYKVAPNGTVTLWATKTQSNVAVYGGAVVVGNYLYVGYRNNSTSQGGLMRYDITSSSPVGVDVVPPGTATFFNLTYRNGFIYVGDYTRHKVIKVDLNNNHAVSDVVSVQYASGCSFDSAGNMYIASLDGRKLWKYTTGSQLIDTGLIFSNYVVDVEIDAFDNIYVATRDEGIRKYTPNLSSYVTIANSAGAYVWGISLGSTGILSWAITGQNKAYQLQTGATISGTPAIGDIGTYSITARATDGTTTDDQNYTLSVYGPATLGTFANMTKYTNDTSFNLTAPTSNSSGAFTYTSSNTAVASISGNTVTIVGAGTATITATQAANGLYLQTTKSLTLTVTAPPILTVTSFSPASAKAGQSVVLSGSGFNATLANNKVFFGSIEATVTAATSTSLTVTVPVGVTTDKISVTNLGTNLATVSNRTFLARYSSYSLDSNYNGTAVDFTTDVQGSSGYNSTRGGQSQYIINDINNDGKPDVLSNITTSAVTHLTNNTSQNNAVTSSDFTALTSTVTGRTSSSMLMADFNGNGKLDILSAEVGQSGNVFRNTSTTSTSFSSAVQSGTELLGWPVKFNRTSDGKISVFSTYSIHNTYLQGTLFTNTSQLNGAVSFSDATNSTGMYQGAKFSTDANGDGQTDIISGHRTTAGAFEISFYRNNNGSLVRSTSSTLSGFAVSGNAIDLNADGVEDFVFINSNGTVQVFANLTATNATSLSLGTSVDITTGQSSVTGGTLADVNDDGKADIIVSGNLGVYCFLNTTSGSTISFSNTAIIIANTTQSQSLYDFEVSDLNGDGKFEIIGKSSSVLRVLNYYLSPTIAVSSNTLTAFSSCTGTSSTEQSFTVSGTNLTANVTATAPTGYEVSLTSGSGYASSVLITASGTLSSTTVYVRMTAAATGTPSGNISISSTGATMQTVAVSGTVNAATAPAAPTATASQKVCTGDTVASLQATATAGNTITWYAASSGGTAIASTTTLLAGTTYYAQSNNTTTGCVSTRTSVTVLTNNALRFDGVDDYVSIGDKFENLGDVTTEAWVYWNGSSNAYSDIFTKENISSFAITSDNKLHTNFGNGTNWVGHVNSNTSIPLNKWTHIAATRENGVVKLFINGVEETTTTTNNATGQNTAPRIIGGKIVSSSAVNFFPGKIDELRFWSIAKTAAQIKSASTVDLVGNETGLVAYYNFDQGIAGGTNTGITTLNDATASANNGTLNNFTLSGSTSNYVAGYFSQITGNSSVVIGGTVQLAHPVSGGTWLSATPAVATIDASGLVTGVAAGTSVITYTNCGQSTTYTITVSAAVPSITSFTPTTAGNGEQVVITGTGFTAATVVKFGNINATSFTVNSDTQITAVVGSGASGDVYVANATNTNSKTGFVYKVVEYKFENNVLDTTDANLDGTVVGTAAYSPGASGTAICFENTYTSNVNTVANFLKIPNNLIRGRSTFTISLRFKTSNYGAILGYQNQPAGVNSSNWVPILYLRSDGKLSANLWTGNMLNVTTANRYDDGNWHKVEFAVTTGSITIYIDGVVAGSSAGSVNHLDMSFNQLAASKVYSWPGVPSNMDWLGFNGCIDEFFIVDQALTANQIQQVTALPQPTITSFTPTTAAVGQTITLTGTNFTGATSVKIGGVVAQSFVVVSATQITAVVANPATSGNVEVITAAGTATATGFTAANTLPTLSSISNQVLCANVTPSPVQFVISDLETALANLAISVTSSNTALLPVSNITFSGTTGARTMNYTTIAGVFGTSTITITVDDLNGGVVSESFTVQVAPDRIVASSTVPTLQVGTPLVLDDQLVINETGLIDGALVLISSGFVSGDVLSFTGTLPSGVTQSYNSSTGVLTFTGSLTPTELQSIFRAVKINTTSNNPQDRTITFNLGSALPYSANNHFYQFITTSGISWTAAKTAAENLSFFGKQGYLATVTSAGENQFILSKIQGEGWMGASDSQTEGVWKWVTGPEAGQQIWQGASGGAAVGGSYNNWGSGEPNDWGTGEDYAHFLNNGKWNDYPLVYSSIQGYVVEFGGLSSDPCVTTSATKTIHVVVNVAPTNILLSASSINENNTVNAVVGNLSSTDADVNDTHTYTLVSGSGSTDNASFTIVGNQLKATAIFNYETKTSYSIRVKSTDAGNLSFEKSFTITVLNVNESPIVSVSQTSFYGVVNVALPTITVTNSGGAALSYAISPTLPAGLNFNTTTGAITGTSSVVAVSSNFTISATNSDGTASVTFALEIDADTDGDGIGNQNDTDIDGDGVSNTQEAIDGTNPLKADTDGDGVIDSTEKTDSTDAKDACKFVLPHQTLTVSSAWNTADCDGDGVPNAQEVIDGTNPIDSKDYKDTDGDGVPNYIEVQEGTNPTVPGAKDSDGDGVPDYIEIVEGTNPNNASNFKDTDGDGKSNYKEGYNYRNSAASLDTDRDGTPDYLDLDSDGDSVLDRNDAFPLDKTEWTDTDHDGIGNNADTDDDNDGISDACDADANGDGIIDNGTDMDRDGTIDSCDSDRDGDGVNNTSDNCPDTPNANQADRDHDGHGDVCDTIELNVVEAITPNGDGINDTWVVYNLENHPGSTVRVFNANGLQVFYSANYQNNWAGNYQGSSEMLPVGSYLYQIDLNGDGTIDSQGWLYITK